MAFHGGWICLHFHQQSMRIPFFPHPHQHMLFLVFLIYAILTAVKQYIVMILICIPLVISDDKHFSSCVCSHLYILLGEVSNLAHFQVLNNFKQ